MAAPFVRFTTPGGPLEIGPDFLAGADATLGLYTANLALPNSGVGLSKEGWVIQPSAAFGGVQANLVEGVAVLWDDLTHQYVMTYVGYTTVAGAPGSGSAMLATSPDLKLWTQLGPILSANLVAGQPDTGGVTGPVMYVANGTYYLFYIGCATPGYEGPPNTLCLATATSLAGPYTRNAANPIIPVGTTPAAAWRSGNIFHPCVLQWQGTYYLFFNALGTVGGAANERTGYATSPDLVTWTVADANSPVLPDAPLNPNGWENSARVGDPSLYRVGNYWFMAYYSLGNVGAADGVAYTTVANFPNGWQRWFAGSPTLVPGTEYNAVDSEFAHKPCILESNAEHYHFYTSVQNVTQKRAIALATRKSGSRRATGLGLVRTTQQVGVASGATTPVGWSSALWASPTFTWPTGADATSVTLNRGGMFAITGYVTFLNNGASGNRLVNVVVNGNPYWCQAEQTTASATDVERLTTHLEVLLNQGDVVQLQVFQSSGAPVTLGKANVAVGPENLFLSITRLGDD